MNEEYKINEKNKFDASALDSAHNLKFSFSFCSWFSFCRFGFRIGEPNGDVKRNQKVYVWDYRIFLNCLIVWVAMVAYQWILGFHPHFFQHYQVSIDQQFFSLSLYLNPFSSTLPQVHSINRCLICSFLFLRNFLLCRLFIASSDSLSKLFNAINELNASQYCDV